MFKKLLALIVISLGMFTSAMAFYVTFKVDMSDYTGPAYAGVFFYEKKVLTL
jgi:hypothetical protein